MSTATTEKVPARVLAAYGFTGLEVEAVAGGLINLTFAVREHGQRVAIVQRLHPVFAAEVNIDIDAVTTHLAAAGLDTPRLLRTREDELWVEHGDDIWRGLTYVEGTTVHCIRDPATAATAGELVGRFHRAVSTLEHEYAFARAGVHDTAAHLARLHDRLDRGASTGEDAMDEQARQLGARILEAARALPSLGELPRRHSHGDLKISNVRFAPGDVTRARCLVDLDTLGHQTLAYELGDALRSWCNPGGEDVTAAEIDVDIFAAAMEGYRAGAGELLTPGERAAIVPGVETVCVELAARFCADVFDDAYFGWDASRYRSRREHNLVRARGQLALARSVATRQSMLARSV